MSKIKLTEINSPDTPSTGIVIVYAKTDGTLACKNDAGVEAVLQVDALVNDLTPQLGGNLDQNGNDINITDAGGILTATTLDAALQENRTAIDLNTAHANSNGTDHTYIDQDVTDGAAPVLDATNFTNLPVDDTAYSAGWDGETSAAPSKNAVYDKIESLTSTTVLEIQVYS